jgi:hypothetical protein
MRGPKRLKQADLYVTSGFKSMKLFNLVQRVFTSKPIIALTVDALPGIKDNVTVSGLNFAHRTRGKSYQKQYHGSDGELVVHCGSEMILATDCTESSNW